MALMGQTKELFIWFLKEYCGGFIEYTDIFMELELDC
jgi:hypothetical protein